MKRRFKSIMLISTLTMGVFVLAGCTNTGENKNSSNEATAKVISTKDLQANLEKEDWVIVDTRINDSYNGWSLNGEKRGGHIPNAVDFSHNWIDSEVENKEEVLDKALKTKGIDKDKNIVLYDSNEEDYKKVESYLKGKGYKNIYSYDIDEWANDESLPLETYDNYEMIVPAKIVKDVIDGNKPATFEDAKEIKIVEASWGEESESYSKGHVPTSVHINTDSVEPPPSWMLAGDEELAKFANDYGFTKDDTVIVTGEEPMAAHRVAIVLRYMGVKDVRVLNGGNSAWVNAGYELETKSNPKTPGNDFGDKVPANKDLVVTIEELKEKLKYNKFTLVDNRSWDEYIGKDSGYSYHDKAGRIPGAVYGYAGTEGSTSLNYYRNIDKTMRNADEIKELWDEQGISTNNHLSFMCGSGWRAAEVLTYANVMGIDDASLYSDGWIGWSNDTSNPTETGEPE